MKLENVDLSKLQLADVPKFDKCPCELCDDGCFDRAGGEHHPECRRKAVQRTQLPAAYRCPVSHYKSTFIPVTNISGGPADHRRQPCPPPPDNEIPIAFKHASMSGVSSQRDHYPPPPPDSLKKTSPAAVKQTDSILSRRTVPMETQSHYQVDYPEKPVLPIAYRSLDIPAKESRIQITDPTAPLSSETTTRAHFPPWQASPSYPYAEMPAIVGHVLFPGTSRNFSTSSGSTFVPFPKTSRTKPVARVENSAYPIRGSMDLQTSYRENYIPLKVSSARPTKKNIVNEEKTFVRRPMNAISQTSMDFRPYPNHRPTSPAPMEPFVSQITIGNSFTPSITKSQYRVDYEGIDTKLHRREPPVVPKDKQLSYVVPYQKMDTMTVTQRDFQPLDIANLPRIRLVPMKATLPINDQRAPMETMTMSRSHYPPHEPSKSKRQYGDPIPEIYIAPSAKFEGSTTSGDTYQGRPGPRARAYVPEIQLINRTGEHDHHTNYRVDYHPHGLTLCAAKAYAIAQKKQKNDVPITAQ